MSDRSNEIAILLGNEEVFLVPSLKATKAISRHFGGLIPALDRIDKLDLEAAATIVAEGTGRAADQVIAGVFETGFDELGAPLSRFLEALANGGKVPVIEEPMA